MAENVVSDGTRAVAVVSSGARPEDRPAGYYTGNPLTKQRDLTAAEAAELAAIDTANTQTVNAASIDSALIAARTRLGQIRTQAQTIQGQSFANNTARDNAIKQLAAAVDDLALLTLRLGRKVLAMYDGTD